MDYSPSSASSSSSTSTLVNTPSPRVHKASLVDPAKHSPALLELLDIQLTQPILEYVVDCVVDTVDFAMARPASSRTRATSTLRPEHRAFTTFLTNVITRAEIATPVILASLVYIDRAKPHLHIALEEWALERVFLGAVIVASKYLNDSTLKNVHWALCTGVFGKRDVGRIEREFLDVLDFELGLKEDDLLAHHANLATIAFGERQVPAQPVLAATPKRTVHCPATPPSHADSYSDSSSGSTSPCTPSTLNNTPSPIPAQNTLPKSSGKQITKRSGGAFHDLLRAFPLPLPSHSRRHSHSKNSTRYSSFPAAPLPTTVTTTTSSASHNSHPQFLVSVRA